MKSWLTKISGLWHSRQKKTTVGSLVNTVENATEEQLAWWGAFSVDEHQSRYFKIGTTVICLDRLSHQWNITTHREGEQPLKSFSAQATNDIRLKPALPDRALLSKMDRPFYIPPGETLMLYLCSPVWIQIETGEPSILLDETPTEILTDTWYGRNTLEGELCFANRSECSTELEDLIRDNTLVVTPVLIENRSRNTLLLKELKLPLPYLSIFSDNQNFLWTEQLNVYQEDPEQTETIIVKGSPKAAEEMQLLNPPRLMVKPGLKNLLSPFMWK